MPCTCACALNLILEMGLLASSTVVLSRFTMLDRLTHETAILQRCANGTGNGAIAVVATQVVEVSLDIDLDTIYTDPAPLDALIQRFGRINRARKKSIVPVYVFREPHDGQGVYQAQLVERTLEELEKHDNVDIDESAIEQWLDAIYNTPQIRNPWNKTYQQQFRLAERLLQSLRPFDSDEKREEAFDQLFDGAEVLPASLGKRYREHVDKREFIEASQLFVPISYKKFESLNRKGKIESLDETLSKRSIVHLPYDPNQGLLFTAIPDLPNDES